MALLQIFDPKARAVPIGIDLGTTNSLVAYVVDGRPECITDCSLAQVRNGAAALPGLTSSPRVAWR